MAARSGGLVGAARAKNFAEIGWLVIYCYGPMPGALLPRCGAAVAPMRGLLLPRVHFDQICGGRSTGASMARDREACGCKGQRGGRRERGCGSAHFSNELAADEELGVDEELAVGWRIRGVGH